MLIHHRFGAQSTGVRLCQNDCPLCHNVANEIQILGIANFLVLIFGSLGLTGVMPLVLSGSNILSAFTACFADKSSAAVYSTVGTIFVFIVLFVVDRVGRRTMFRK